MEFIKEIIQKFQKIHNKIIRGQLQMRMIKKYVKKYLKKDIYLHKDENFFQKDRKFLII